MVGTNIEGILERATRSAEEAEIYSVESEETPVSFEANRLKQIENKESRGMALRLLRTGRIGLASTTKVGEREELVDRALALAEIGVEARFHFPSRVESETPKIYDERVPALKTETMVALGEELIAKVHEYDPSILVNVDITKHRVKSWLLNSRGGRAEEEKTVFSVGVNGNLVRGTDMLDIWEGDRSCRCEPDVAGLANRLIQKFDWARNGSGVATGMLPVLFTPKGVASIILEPLLVAFNGKTVWQKASPLSDKLGQAVFDQRISLWDDGTIDYAVASSGYDDEGVAVRRLPLIQDGIVHSFYYDLQTAGLAGRTSTGHGYRSLHSLPNPSTTSIVLKEGDADWDGLLGEINEGILIDQSMGSWAGNLLAGDFSANVHLGYKIEKGRIVGRVKDTMVAGNIYEVLKNSLLAIGREAQWVGPVKTPPIAFKALSVSSRG